MLEASATVRMLAASGTTEAPASSGAVVATLASLDASAVLVVVGPAGVAPAHGVTSRAATGGWGATGDASGVHENGDMPRAAAIDARRASRARGGIGSSLSRVGASRSRGQEVATLRIIAG